MFLMNEEQVIERDERTEREKEQEREKQFKLKVVPSVYKHIGPVNRVRASPPHPHAPSMLTHLINHQAAQIAWLVIRLCLSDLIGRFVLFLTVSC
jgi:hypothetical protein